MTKRILRVDVSSPNSDITPDELAKIVDVLNTMEDWQLTGEREYEPRKETKQELEEAGRRARKLTEDIDGKKVTDILPITLAADVFVIMKSAMEGEPALQVVEEDIKNLLMVCTYAGLMYGRNEHE